MTDFLVAESGVRQLQARYIDSVWRKDFDAFGDCFAEDAEWRIAGRVLRGRAECVALLRQAMAHINRVLILMQPPILEVGDETAVGRTYMTEMNALKDHPAIFAIGVYYERFVQQGDRWRFQWRHYQSHYHGPGDLSAAFAQIKDYGAPFGMPAPGEPAPDTPAESLR
jgi:hypothetical protein